MTELEKLQIKTLLWKEWKQVRVFVALAVFIIVAFGMMAVFDEIDLIDTLPGGAVMASVLTTLGLGVLAYGLEINEKTVSYLATRPVTHPQVFLVKVSLCLAVAWSVAFVAWILCWWMGPQVFTLKSAWFDESVDLFVARWWLYVPLAYLTVMFAVLAIRPIVPSLIVSISAGLGALYLAAVAPVWTLLLACPLLLLAAYLLASNRLHTEGA
jgi:hypothetical protein